jgi:hypothetical protein
MLIQHDGHRRLRVLMVHVEYNTLLTHVLSQGALGLITPAVITPPVLTPVLLIPVLTTPVLLHPYERCAATECILVLVPLLI